MTAKKADFSPESFHLIEKLEHLFDPSQVGFVSGSHVLDSPKGANSLLGERHNPVRRLIDRPDKPMRQ
ncbi:MAG: hypothetical protein ABI604_05600 [Nitrospirota bacterium]